MLLNLQPISNLLGFAFDLHEVGTILSIVLGSLALLGVGYTLSVRLAKLELKVDTIWEFLIRRAFSEAIQKGIATLNSPVVVTQAAKAMMDPLAFALRTFYINHGHHLTDTELMMEIERQFGDEILHKICIPNGFLAGACLVIAAQVAKEIPGMVSSIEAPPQKSDKSIDMRRGDTL